MNRRHLSVGLLLGFAAVAQAEPPATTASSDRPSVMTSDNQLLTQASAFLREYHRALTTGDQQYLSAHTSFPLAFSEGVLDMEAKVETRTLKSLDEFLKVRRVVRWPTALVPKGPEHLSGLKTGREKCGDAKKPDVPSLQKGEPAFVLKGDEASLTYIAAPCESETHMVTLRFKREGDTWRLRERAVRMGPK
jgi:hypothetical protein